LGYSITWFTQAEWTSWTVNPSASRLPESRSAFSLEFERTKVTGDLTRLGSSAPHHNALMRALFPECISCAVDRWPNLRHSWRPLGLNKTRISIERLSGGGPYQVVVDVHDEAQVTTDELLNILTAIWGPETAGEMKQLILDETGSFEAEAALPVWPTIRLLSILSANEARVSSR
jgi:hypothetical protein